MLSSQVRDKPDESTPLQLHIACLWPWHDDMRSHGAQCMLAPGSELLSHKHGLDQSVHADEAGPPD